MKLRQEGAQPYQGLKPDGIEGNAFNYHLRSLKKAGLIENKGDKYSLSPTGFLVSDGFSSPAARLMMRPYAHMAMLVTSGNKILLYRATRQPLKDIYGMPSGKMRYGDDLPTSIARELMHRGITDHYTASFLCQSNVLYMKDGEVVIHRPGALWHIEYEGKLESVRTFNGVSDWFDIDKLNELQPLSPEVREALQRVENRSHEPIDSKWDIAR